MRVTIGGLLNQKHFQLKKKKKEKENCSPQKRFFCPSVVERNEEEKKDMNSR